MSKSTIDVAQSIWQWVLSSVILSDSNTALINKWICGEKQPTFNQIEKFSKDTRVPLGYFFLKTPPIDALNLLEFRTVDSTTAQNPSRDLIDTVRHMENIQEWMREYLVSSGADKVAFVGAVNPNNSTVSVAGEVRKVLGLSINWFEKSKTLDESFKTLREAISNIGVVIMMNGIVGNNTRRNLNVDEFRAFALIDEFAPLIFINSTDSKGGKIFSVLHEFIHIGAAQNSLYNPRQFDLPIVNPLETFCNSVTAEIITPIEMFNEKWKLSTSNASAKINTLSNFFKCS